MARAKILNRVVVVVHITAKQIADWAQGKEAQASLPRLVRRLVHAAGPVRLGSFPAGDSTSAPGWDGVLVCDFVSPWVPKGNSFWEFSCEGRVTEKANQDYDKRTAATPLQERSTSTLVILTARRWAQKGAWQKAKLEAGEWAGVRALDADDLEQWLEQSPAVALQLADELGLAGPGVESVTKLWGAWSDQSEPRITRDAIFVGREGLRERVLADLKRAIDASGTAPYAVKADNVGEATAFVCAVLLEDPDLESTSLVVTHPDGWRYVDKHPTVKVVVAADPEVAEAPTRRNGLAVVVPFAAGDLAGQYPGAGGPDPSNATVLERPSSQDFEKALVTLGIDEGSAERYASSTGRSWSVFRRQRSTNPAIRKPAWLDAPQAASLSTICLLGAWSGNQAADLEVVEFLSGRAYEAVERDLQFLAHADDAPILHIGHVWKAKAPLELLGLFGERITSAELNRFFAILRGILGVSDPALDLPDDQRFAAQIYGKVRPHSAILIGALCDTLVKLAVRGPAVSHLAAINIEGQVSSFVGSLLMDADGIRWLSLSSHLRPLAEAAPEAFLKAAERSLTLPEAPVTRLITETGNASLGRCWHADLLWALETLAWAPKHLPRAALLLARLAHTPVKGNWGNTPLASLIDIFRSWLPQTAASLSQRVEVLDLLVRKEPDVAFDLLERLVNTSLDRASPNARPHWREDDAGAGRGVTWGEMQEMLTAVADRLLALAQGHPQRLARLIEQISQFDTKRARASLTLAHAFAVASAKDEDKEVLRNALRKHISRCRNFDKVRGRALDMKLQRFEQCYASLEPVDLVVRHRWLFADGWCEIPVYYRDDPSRPGRLLGEWRATALHEIRTVHGWAGVNRLATSCSGPHWVGMTLAQMEVPSAEITCWVTAEGAAPTLPELTRAVRGLLRGITPDRRMEVLHSVVEHSRREGWDADRLAAILILAPEERATWDAAAACGTDVEARYWAKAEAACWLGDDASELQFAVRRLLDAGRPLSAFEMCHVCLERVEPEVLYEILDRALRGEEPDGPRIDSWRVGEAISLLEKSDQIDPEKLVLLEFRLAPMLEPNSEQRAESLYRAITSDAKLFCDVLSLVYHPHSGSREEPPSEYQSTLAHLGWHTLHYCHRVPGALPDGTIDAGEIMRFVDSARELCRQEDRLEVCDITLGEILAYAPANADGSWPCTPVCGVLDRPELEDMRRGFRTGVFNKRGATWRSLDAGGTPERDLATRFRGHASSIRVSYPNVAEALEEIARDYDRIGLAEDVEVGLRREGY